MIVKLMPDQIAWIKMQAQSWEVRRLSDGDLVLPSFYQGVVDAMDSAKEEKGDKEHE